MSMKFKLYAGIALLGTAFLLWQHYQWMAKRLAQSQLESRTWQGLYLGSERNRVFETSEIKALNAEVERYQQALANIKPKTEVIKEYVIQYRDNPTIKRCDLSGEWVHAYNSAVRMSDPTGSLSGVFPTIGPAVDDSTVLDVVTQNIDNYHRLVARYQSLYNHCSGLITRYNAEVESAKNERIKGK